MSGKVRLRHPPLSGTPAAEFDAVGRSTPASAARGHHCAVAQNAVRYTVSGSDNARSHRRKGRPTRTPRNAAAGRKAPDFRLRRRIGFFA